MQGLKTVIVLLFSSTVKSRAIYRVGKSREFPSAPYCFKMFYNQTRSSHASNLLDAFLYFVLAELTQFREETNQGFTFQHGRLVVESSGYYFIYAQVWIEYFPGYNRNRLAITLNGKTTLSLLQKAPKSDYGSLYSGLVKYLSAGEYIGLKAIYPSKLWMEPAHTFFGAHKIN